jgi:hypothetical protein
MSVLDTVTEILLLLPQILRVQLQPDLAALQRDL